MFKIRKARAWEEEKAFETPAKQNGIDKILAQLLEEDGISLPSKEKESPSKRRKSPGHDAVEHVKFLYFKNYEGLTRALREFRIRSPKLSDNDAKLNYLLDKLTLAVNSTKMRTTPRSTGQRWPPQSLERSATHNGCHADTAAAPSSPTLSIKHAPQEPFKVPYLQPPPSQSIPEPKSGITSANTSFNTNLNTSFWSDVKPSQEAPESPATSIASFDGANDVDCTQISEFSMSSISDATFDAQFDNVKPLACRTSSMDFGQPFTFPEEVALKAGLANITPPTDSSGESGKLKRKRRRVGAEGDEAYQPRSTDYGGSTAFWEVVESEINPAAVTPSKIEHHSTQGQLKKSIQPSSARKCSDDVTVPQKPAPCQAMPPPTPPARSPESIRRDSPLKTKESPSKTGLENVRVKRIPLDGISDIALSDIFMDVPFHLRFEASRVMQACKLDPSELAALWMKPRTFASLHEVAKELKPAYNAKNEGTYKDCSLSMKLRWTDSKSGPLFVPQILPPAQEKLHSFQRKFGTDRFLTVEVDPLSKPPKCLGLGGQSDNMIERFSEMIDQEHELWGRTWRAFHVRNKARRKGSDAESARSGITQYTFVALRGDGMVELDLRTVIEHALPLSKNGELQGSKAFARLDLRLSRADLALELTPDDIKRVMDALATEDPPDTKYNDPNFDHGREIIKKVVMNDGCSEVPVGTMRRIARALKLKYTPTAVQFRCAGAKGMIFIGTSDDDAEDSDDRSPGPVLLLTESQTKVTLWDEDLDPDLYDPRSLDFYVNSFSQPLVASSLYLDFLPILIDRHVPPEAIEKIASEQARLDVEEFLQALTNPKLFLRRWIHQQNAVMEERRRDNEIPALGGYPRADTERAIMLIEAGFEVLESRLLADLVLNIAKASFASKVRACKFTLPRSTSALGVVDPTGKLEPGQIHLSFSSPFEDPTAGRTWSHLSGPVLVARNPSARPSDIQKVDAVYIPELGNRHDVFYFSAKGPQSLADKLSGGDYDGDKFWCCWEPSLVGPFMNAPAPQKLPEPQSLGIEVDNRKLSEIVPDPNSEEQVHNFVRIGIRNRLTPNLLGTVTKTLARFTHEDNSISSETATYLADLKDLLMDSDKNGRFLSSQTWEKIKRDKKLCHLPTPAYFKHTSGDDESSENLRYKPADPKNIIDKVFRILKSTYEKALRSAAQNEFANAKTYDGDLTVLYELVQCEAVDRAVIRAELSHMRQELDKLSKLWKMKMDDYMKTKQHEKRSAWDSAVVECRNFYLDIKPKNDTGATISEWVRQHGYALTTWDKLKASALTRLYYAGKMWIQIAAREICILKSDASGGTRTIVPEVYLGMTVARGKKRRIDAAEVDDRDDEDGGNDDEELNAKKDSRLLEGGVDAITGAEPMEF